MLRRNLLGASQAAQTNYHGNVISAGDRGEGLKSVLYSRRLGLDSGHAPGVTQQLRPPRLADLAIEAQKRTLISRLNINKAGLALPRHEVADGYPEHRGHPRQIGANLPGPVSLPLRDRAARDANTTGKLILCQAKRPTGFTNSERDPVSGRRMHRLRWKRDGAGLIQTTITSQVPLA